MKEEKGDAKILQVQYLKPNFCITFIKINGKVRVGVDAPNIEYAFDLNFIDDLLDSKNNPPC